MAYEDIPCVVELKEKFPEVDEKVLYDAYRRAKNTLLDCVFPFEYDVVELPEDMPRLEEWVYDCAIEILAVNNITDGMPLTLYKENGVTLEWDSSMLSQDLRDRCPPSRIKVVGKK